MTTKKIAVGVATLAAVAWAGLFFSSKAVLVWGSGPEGDAVIGTLTCTYFTGTGLVERNSLYTEGGVVGRAACPRLIDL